MNPEVTLLYLHSKDMGYGRAGVKIAEALVRAGVDVYDIQDSPAAPQLYTPAYELERAGGHGTPSGTRSKNTNVMCLFSTPGHTRGWWEGQHAAVFTMFETTKLPEAHRESLHEFATVLVPSRQNVELFSEYNDNVRYVPLGIDPDDWRFTPRKQIRDEFRFLIGGSGQRKGTDLAFDAFKAVFGPKYDGPIWKGSGPAPVLVMKQPRIDEGCWAPWVQTVAGKISNEDERTLYELAHCYVQPSRGEGFGLQPLQAIAQGLPTILTNAHGQADYAHLGIPISAKLGPAGYFAVGNAPGAQWWEPDFDELCEAMHAVYSDYEKYQGAAIANAAEVARRWTWDNSARAFIAAFDGQLERPGPGQHRWHEPDAKLYRVRLRRHWEGQIGDFFRILEPGEDYYERADVKRIFFDSDLLDPACLEGDTGLTEEQLATIPHREAMHAYCYTCGQELNTRSTKTDAIEAELAADDQFEAVVV